MRVRAPLLTLLAVAFMMAINAPAFGVLIMQGTETLSTPFWTADIAYEVYYDQSLPRPPVVVLDNGAPGLDDPEANDLYNYIYTVTNLQSSSYELTRLTLGIEGLPGQYVDIGYLPGPWDIAPSNISVGSGSILFDFGPGGDGYIGPGEMSHPLFVTSSLPPGTVFASLVNHGTADTDVVPAPVPEPSSMLLLGSLASGLIVARRARARKTA